MPSTVPEPGSLSLASRYPDYLHVVAAAIVDRDGNVLIARRPPHLHQGDLWEFPGGKVEPGEDATAALARELDEELGIGVTHARPLICVPYRYPERAVFLDVWLVDGFSGEAHGREGQPVRWVARTELSAYDFPAANRRIITALSLPDRYLITPEPGAPENWPRFLQHLAGCLRGGIRLVQLRAKTVAPASLTALTRQVRALCHDNGARLLLNAEPALALASGADGVHLTSQALHAQHVRPLSSELLVAASCHTVADVHHANAIAADFVVLSPVKSTASHPGAAGIGWESFAGLCDASLAPAYALGGMDDGDVMTAQGYGGQGIAAISGLWDGCGSAR